MSTNRRKWLILDTEFGNLIHVRFPNDRMYFWRNQAFNSLTEAAKAASAIPAWNEYVKFCELLDKGLRKDALTHLTVLIQQAATWTFSEKKNFISWLYNFIQQHTDTYLLIPHPLYEEFIKPTFFDWIEREPNNGEPHRWLGTPDHLKTAIRLNPEDEIARSRLAETIINGVGYAVHELPYGYLGDANEDLQALSEVEANIAEISDKETREGYKRRVTELRESIEAYLNRKAET